VRVMAANTRNSEIQRKGEKRTERRTEVILTQIKDEGPTGMKDEG
jgi:hypothetical protein